MKHVPHQVFSFALPGDRAEAFERMFLAARQQYGSRVTKAFLLQVVLEEALERRTVRAETVHELMERKSQQKLLKSKRKGVANGQ